MHCRTIVVCNQSEEVFELVRRLNEVRITPAYCHDNSTIAEICNCPTSDVSVDWFGNSFILQLLRNHGISKLLLARTLCLCAPMRS